MVRWYREAPRVEAAVRVGDLKKDMKYRVEIVRMCGVIWRMVWGRSWG